MPIEKPVSVFMWTTFAFFFPAGYWFAANRNLPVAMLYMLPFTAGILGLFFFGAGILILIPLGFICAIHTFFSTRAYNREIVSERARQDMILAAAESTMRAE